jgi:hypothetical protein
MKPEIIYRKDGQPFYLQKDGTYTAQDEHGIESLDPKDASLLPFHNTQRDWTEDFSHENGNYMCICSICKEKFYGHKRRPYCKLCSKPVSENELKTSEEWSKNSSVIILDPDGWDRCNFQFSWYEEKITFEEFEMRTFISTCQRKTANSILAEETHTDFYKKYCDKPQDKFLGELPADSVPADDTKKLLADIISWELDLSSYPSLETVLRDRYSITLKKDAKPFTKREVHELIEHKGIPQLILREKRLQEELLSFIIVGWEDRFKDHPIVIKLRKELSELKNKTK